MKTHRLHIALTAALIGTLALVGCKKNEAPAPMPPVASDSLPATTPAPVATTSSAMVSGVDLGNAVGADMRVTAPMTSFATSDTIYAAVATNTSDPAATVPGKLGVKWTHVDSGQTVHEETKDISFAGDGVTNFQISKPDGWPTGRYKVEIMLDGAVVQTREFEVK